MTPDCRECGACCIADYEGEPFVSLLGPDLRRLSRKTVRLRVVQENSYPHLAVKKDAKGNTVCVFLRGRVGERVSCRIYNNRPQPCRDFTPGGHNCRMARAQAEVL